MFIYIFVFNAYLYIDGFLSKIKVLFSECIFLILVHAAVIAVNEAIDRQVTEDTVAALENPAVHLVNVNTELSEEYQAVLYAAKYSKAEIARNKVSVTKLLKTNSNYV